ncbi:Lysosomal acid phosphatase [Taenia crassiceps]|uniref:acid phosphatase n=1 Tax=Taenia crassiceps TaxID=6207 RepID=A0ABR4QKZ1_9CEST
MSRILGFFTFLYFICVANGEYNLVHVHALFRHGDRSSITPYIFDGYDPYKVWPDGLGQLTQEGIEQLFLLGKWLRNKYGSLVGQNYNVSSFHMRSSDVDRSLMSAEAMMAGFFHLSDSPLSKYGLQWRPVPTHTVPTTTDSLLSVEPCPRMAQRRNELLQSNEGLDLFKQHKKTIENVGASYGIKNITLMDIWRITDDLLCLRSHNATLPKWCTQDVAKELDLITDKLFRLLFTDREILKLAVGVFLKDAFDRMEEYIHKNATDPSSPLESLLAYSAHDTNVAPLLGALGAHVEEHRPQYAALIAMELLAPSTDAPPKSGHLLRLYYKRGWTDEAGSYLQFNACRDRKAKEGCAFALVRESIAALLLAAEEIEGACKADWLPSRYRLIVAITLSTFLALLFFTLAAVYCVVWRQRCWQRSQRGSNFGIASQLPYSPLVSTPPTA